MLAALIEADGPLTGGQIAERTGLAPASIGSAVGRLQTVLRRLPDFRGEIIIPRVGRGGGYRLVVRGSASASNAARLRPKSSGMTNPVRAPG